MRNGVRITYARYLCIYAYQRRFITSTDRHVLFVARSKIQLNASPPETNSKLIRNRNHEKQKKKRLEMYEPCVERSTWALCLCEFDRWLNGLVAWTTVRRLLDWIFLNGFECWIVASTLSLFCFDSEKKTQIVLLRMWVLRHSLTTTSLSKRFPLEAMSSRIYR